ncbi:MAG TPA: HNH endonuclease signature motif containing protein, partial [Ilumatobacter sp.]|nr:HNH endonuclease signature motif containing protein [Ilumatobacter sp.]
DGQRLLAQLSNGVALPDALRHYLTCDGCVTPVWERDFVAIGYGREVRIVPAKLRRIIERRDRGCRVPGCGAKHFEAHHIIHWEHGGVTETWNLVSLCPQHHRLLHLGQLIIRGNPDDRDGLEFFDATGRQIRGPDFTKPDQPPSPPGKPYEPPSGEHMNLRWFSGWTHPNTLTQHRSHHPPN